MSTVEVHMVDGKGWGSEETPLFVEVDGIRMSWEFLQHLTRPSGEWLRFERLGDQVFTFRESCQRCEGQIGRACLGCLRTV